MKKHLGIINLSLNEYTMAEKIDKMDYFASFKLFNYYKMKDVAKSQEYLRISKLKQKIAFSEESLRSSKIYNLPIILPDEFIVRDFLRNIKPSILY